MARTGTERFKLRHLRAWSVLAAAGLAGLLVSACSSPPAQKDAVKAKPTTSTTTTTAVQPTCPLTGEPAPGGTVPQRPAMAVKIDNYPAGRPQSGLDKADIIFEEPVEGGITRFAAVFQCQSSDLDRSRPLGPQHRHRHSRATGHSPVGARRWHQSGDRQHRRLADRERRHREQPVAHDPPTRPRGARLGLHLERHRLRHASEHDHPAPTAVHLLGEDAARRHGDLERQHRLLGDLERDVEMEQGHRHLPALLQRNDAGHVGQQRAERRGQRRRAVRAGQLRAVGSRTKRGAWRSRPTCTPTPAARPSSTATATPFRARGTAPRSARPPNSSTTSAWSSRCSRARPGSNWCPTPSWRRRRRRASS